MSLKLKNINKSFDDISIFDNFNIEFQEGEITCILGPSGCGKTTLLNIIGGLTKIDDGIMEGFSDKRISYIFQEPRLLPWKTVRENIEFVLDENMTSSEKREIVNELLRLVELESFADYYPSQLSGGMAQRVSIARAFAIPSQIILMDEPLSGLDSELKHNILRHFTDIWKKDRRTVIYVTHDSEEAAAIGNEIFVFSKAPVKILSQKKNLEI